MSPMAVREHYSRLPLYKHVFVGAAIGASLGLVFISEGDVRGSSKRLLTIFLRTFIGSSLGFLVAEGRRTLGQIQFDPITSFRVPFTQWVFPTDFQRVCVDLARVDFDDPYRIG